MAVLTGEPDLHPNNPYTDCLLRSWTEAATRAHAILTQALPDEVLDEILAHPGPRRTPFKLPAVLAG